MFKLVVLCAFFAAAAASAPFLYSTSVLAPATTTISKSASSVIHPSPLFYSSPWGYSAPVAYSHLIKKRAVPLAVSPYIAPASYIAPYSTYHAPLATTYTAPLVTSYANPLYTPYAHFIKKRSASLLLPSTYIAPTTYAAPFVTSTYFPRTHFVSTPVVSAAPVAYSHFIKKRSAPLALTSYFAPAAVSHQSRLDIKQTPGYAYSTYSPFAYSPAFYAHAY